MNPVSLNDSTEDRHMRPPATVRAQPAEDRRFTQRF